MKKKKPNEVAGFVCFLVLALLCLYMALVPVTVKKLACVVGFFVFWWLALEALQNRKKRR